MSHKIRYANLDGFDYMDHIPLRITKKEWDLMINVDPDNDRTYYHPSFTMQIRFDDKRWDWVIAIIAVKGKASKQIGPHGLDVINRKALD